MKQHPWYARRGVGCVRPRVVSVVVLFITTMSGSLASSLPVVDKSVRPGDAFFQYVNGTWLKATDIPPDRASIGDDVVLSERNDQRTLQIIQETARAKHADVDARKLADYYNTCMDEATIEQRGLQPLEPLLKQIAAIHDRKSLSHVLGSQLRADVDVLNNTEVYTDKLFGLWVAQDLDDPRRYVPFLLQGGIGMPDRDYYLDNSPDMHSTRAKSRTHLANVLTLAKIADADAKAARLFQLE